MRVGNRIQNFEKRAGSLSLAATAIMLPQVVVKPSGWRCNGAQAVSFHDKSERGSVLQVVLTLLETLEEDESILLEPFIPTAHILRSGPLVTNNSPGKE